MNEQNIREAIDYCKKNPDKKSVDVLIALAEAYLKAGKEMPEKKEIGEMRYGGCNPDFDNGYNQAIDDCKMARMKKLDGLEEVISEYIWNNKQVYDGSCRELATAIRKHMEGR